MRDKRSLSKLVGGFIGLAFLGMAGSANASLIGDTVSCSVTGGGSFDCTPSSAVVGAGTEFGVGNSSFPNAIGVDLGAASVDLLFNFTGNLNRTIINLTDLDWVGAKGFLTGATLDSTSRIIGLSQSDLTTGPDSLIIDLRGTRFLRNATASISLQTVHAVAEPATLGIFGASLLGLGLMVRRRRRAA